MYAILFCLFVCRVFVIKSCIWTSFWVVWRTLRRASSLQVWRTAHPRSYLSSRLSQRSRSPDFQQEPCPPQPRPSCHPPCRTCFLRGWSRAYLWHTFLLGRGIWWRFWRTVGCRWRRPGQSPHPSSCTARAAHCTRLDLLCPECPTSQMCLQWRSAYESLLRLSGHTQKWILRSRNAVQVHSFQHLCVVVERKKKKVMISML